MIRRLHIPLAHVVLLLSVPAALTAQGVNWPKEGDRVRFVSDELSGESRVAALLEESLLLERDSISPRFAVPTATLERLEVYRGRRSRLKGFLVGSMAGSLLGGGVGALVGAAVWGGREIWEEIRLRGTPGRSLLADRGDEAGSRMDTITREEIAAFPEGDAMEVVQRLRPGWLRPRTQATIQLRARDRHGTGWKCGCDPRSGRLSRGLRRSPSLRAGGEPAGIPIERDRAGECDRRNDALRDRLPRGDHPCRDPAVRTEDSGARVTSLGGRVTSSASGDRCGTAAPVRLFAARGGRGQDTWRRLPPVAPDALRPLPQVASLVG